MFSLSLWLVVKVIDKVGNLTHFESLIVLMINIGNIIFELLMRFRNCLVTALSSVAEELCSAAQAFVVLRCLFLIFLHTSAILHSY